MDLSKIEVFNIPFNPAADISEDFADLGELEEGEFRGLASVFSREIEGSFIPTIIERGAFTKTLQERGLSIPILWQHDMSEPIGKPSKLFQSDDGLIVQAKLSRTTRGKDALTLMRDGVVNSLSIGFEPMKVRFEDNGNGEQMRHISEIRLFEISLVTIPADSNALIREVRSQSISSDGTTPAVIETISQDELVTLFTTFVAANREGMGDAAIVEAFSQTLVVTQPEVALPLMNEEMSKRLRQANLFAAKMLSDSL